MYRAIAAMAMLLCVQVHAADAPATVGALLEGGGKQLTRNEILKGFAGATISGNAMGATGSTFQLKYMPDGTAIGEGRTLGTVTKIAGKWGTNEQNEYCQDLKTAEGRPIQGCFPYFTWKGRLFAAPKNDKAERVYERQLTR